MGHNSHIDHGEFCCANLSTGLSQFCVWESSVALSARVLCTSAPSRIHSLYLIFSSAVSLMLVLCSTRLRAFADPLPYEMNIRLLNYCTWFFDLFLLLFEHYEANNVFNVFFWCKEGERHIKIHSTRRKKKSARFQGYLPNVWRWPWGIHSISSRDWSSLLYLQRENGQRLLSQTGLIRSQMLHIFSVFQGCPWLFLRICF